MPPLSAQTPVHVHYSSMNPWGSKPHEESQGTFNDGLLHPRDGEQLHKVWVAVKELNLSYCIGETYITIVVIQFKFLNSNPEVA